MREFLISCAKNLTENRDILKTYEEIGDFYQKEGYTRGYASTLEKIWHIKKEPETLLKLSEYASKELNDARLACLFKGMFFYNYSPSIFKEFLESIKLDKDFIAEIILESKTNDLILLIHRHFVCSFLMIYLHGQKDLDLVMDLSNYLRLLCSQIEEMKKISEFHNAEELSDYERDKRALSSVLSSTENHNDINKLAIFLDKKNEKAYLNIIEDLLIYGNYGEAQEFYNKEYAPVFNKPQLVKVQDICWEMNQKNSQKYSFYKSLLFQKIAIEIELKEEKIEG